MTMFHNVRHAKSTLAIAAIALVCSACDDSEFVTEESGDAVFEEPTLMEADVERSAGNVFSCVINVDNDATGYGPTGVNFSFKDYTQSYDYSYSKWYASGTTDSQIRDDIAAHMATKSNIRVHKVGRTTLVLATTHQGHRPIACSGHNGDFYARVGGKWIRDWGIEVYEIEPKSSQANERYPEPVTSANSTLVLGPGSHQNPGGQNDYQACISAYNALPNPGGWWGVGSTAIIHPVGSASSVNCSSNDPQLGVYCKYIETTAP